MPELEVDSEIALGVKLPEAIFAEMDSLVESNLTPAADFSTVQRNYNGLREGSKHIKNIFGAFKQPVAARFSVIDMNTSEYIVTSTKFILGAVQLATREKYQISYGFDEEWLFSVFGKDVSIYVIAGTLVNFRRPHDWVKDFKELYEDYMRAYVLVRNNWMAVLHYSNRWIRGYPINFSEVDNADMGTYSGFNLSMVVRKDRMC